MSSASTSATSTSSGHTEVSNSDRQIAAADSILHPRARLARLKSGGATFSAGYATSTNSQRDRVCAPHALQSRVFRFLLGRHARRGANSRFVWHTRLRFAPCISGAVVLAGGRRSGPSVSVPACAPTANAGQRLLSVDPTDEEEPRLWQGSSSWTSPG